MNNLVIRFFITVYHSNTILDHLGLFTLTRDTFRTGKEKGSVATPTYFSELDSRLDSIGLC